MVGGTALHRTSPKTLRLRTERPTLRRLPRTDAIVFRIRTYQVRADELIKGGIGVGPEMLQGIKDERGRGKGYLGIWMGG
ncbi:hypothetical protein M404DRAFT_1002877 [Pisolithus tinctorius Marx 270]|uniref:Uncharacterized protein n=1 Tax=Pisolithus tinctorius Marx 270 TaxID=870435 RepID=A0A0C3P381_PISTI|nr:hypothetical protein M404DRAFT_1002877 [Pisolithus tinctorius Marx 270]